MSDELVAELEEQGCHVSVERQNEFKVESSRSGTVIHGRPDVIAIHPDGRATIYDVKTGQESPSHVVQVMLYMYLIPKAVDGRWHGATFDGAVVYPSGHVVSVPAGEVDVAFIQRVARFVQKMISDVPTRRVPSMSECNWCDIAKADCPERVEPEIV